MKKLELMALFSLVKPFLILKKAEHVHDKDTFIIKRSFTQNKIEFKTGEESRE